MKASLDGIGYFIAFKLMPELFDCDKQTFIAKVLKEKETFFHYIYNDVYKTSKKIPKSDNTEYIPLKDFKVTKYDFDRNNHLLYIEIPYNDKQAFIRCKAFVITYTQVITFFDNARLFMIEESKFGTTAIGSMTIDGQHSNYGPASTSQKDNVEMIKEMVFKK